jgi:hypothetical protein
MVAILASMGTLVQVATEEQGLLELLAWLEPVLLELIPMELAEVQEIHQLIQETQGYRAPLELMQLPYRTALSPSQLLCPWII